MKFSILIVFSILLLIVTVTVSENSTEYRILRVGQFHGSQVESSSEKDWYGLFKTDYGFEISPVHLGIGKCYDALLDKPGETTGKQISIRQRRDPLILIQNNKLQKRLLPTTVHNINIIELGKPISLGFMNGVHNTLIALGEISDEGIRHPSDLLIKKYTLKFLSRKNSETVRQVLVSYDRLGSDGIPMLLWSGDLDGDGKIDLLLDITNHYNVTHYALYLSSKAVGEDAVKLVAEFRTTGC